jgi:ABC-type lipopolysaccharide export system ATPase subunit
MGVGPRTLTIAIFRNDLRIHDNPILTHSHLATVKEGDLTRKNHVSDYVLPLYVFDEPLAAVDPLTRDRVIDLIRHERQPGSTVLISTRLIAGLETLFDAAIVIDAGRVLLHTETSAIASHGSLEARIKEVLT